MRNRLIKLITTFFYVGYLPFIPGTFGSIAGVAVYLLIKNNIVLYLGAILIITALGFIFSGPAERLFNKKDPRFVVIDEVSGMLISLIFIPVDLKFVIMGFFLFRLFDTLKPYPIYKLEKIGSGFGIMADDIIAGFYANIVLQAVVRLASLRML